MAASGQRPDGADLIVVLRSYIDRMLKEVPGMKVLLLDAETTKVGAAVAGGRAGGEGRGWGGKAPKAAGPARKVPSRGGAGTALQQTGSAVAQARWRSGRSCSGSREALLVSRVLHTPSAGGATGGCTDRALQLCAQ